MESRRYQETIFEELPINLKESKATKANNRRLFLVLGRLNLT